MVIAMFINLDYINYFASDARRTLEYINNRDYIEVPCWCCVSVHVCCDLRMCNRTVYIWWLFGRYFPNFPDFWSKIPDWNFRFQTGVFSCGSFFCTFYSSNFFGSLRRSHHTGLPLPTLTWTIWRTRCTKRMCRKMIHMKTLQFGI